MSGLLTFHEALSIIKKEGGQIARYGWSIRRIGYGGNNQLHHFDASPATKFIIENSSWSLALSEVESEDWVICIPRPYKHIYDKNINSIAQMCHAINREYCYSIGEENVSKGWEGIPKEMKDSIIAGVAFYFSNPGVTSEEMHEEWAKTKMEQGWVWGPDKNEEAKIHPCLLPYSDLPETQKFKDYLFRSVCAMNAHLINI